MLRRGKSCIVPSGTFLLVLGEGESMSKDTHRYSAHWCLSLNDGEAVYVIRNVAGKEDSFERFA